MSTRRLLAFCTQRYELLREFVRGMTPEEKQVLRWVMKQGRQTFPINSDRDEYFLFGLHRKEVVTYMCVPYGCIPKPPAKPKRRWQ